MIRNVAWQAIATGTRVVISVGAFAFVVRHVPADDLGRFGISWALCGAGIAVVQTPTNQAIIGMQTTRGQHISAAYVLCHGFSVFLSAFILASAPFLSAIYGDARLSIGIEYAALIVFLSAFGVVNLSISQRDLNFRTVALSQIVGAAGSAAVSLIICYYGDPLLGLFIVQGLSPVFQFAFLMVVERRPALVMPGKSDFRDLLRRESSVAFGALVGAILNGLPAMIIGLVAPLHEVGLFAICKRLIEQVNSQVGAVVNQVLFPTLARLRGNRNALSSNFLIVARYSFTLSVVPLLLLSTSPDAVLTLYTGAYGGNGTSVLMLLCLMQLGYALGQNVNPTFLAIERYDFAWKWNAIMAVTQSFLLYFLGKTALTAASALAISAILVPGTVWYLSRMLGFAMTDWARQIALPLSLAIATTLLGQILGVALNGTTSALFKFIVITGTCMLLYAGPMVFLDRALKEKVHYIVVSIRVKSWRAFDSGKPPKQ